MTTIRFAPNGNKQKFRDLLIKHGVTTEEGKAWHFAKYICGMHPLPLARRVKEWRSWFRDRLEEFESNPTKPCAAAEKARVKK